MGKSQKNYMSIRSKLMAAVAMLLVASFMVVSSTYAWFTLSTAPEVTGIKTSVGANGNLEIALLYDANADATKFDALAKAVQTTTGGLTELTDLNKTWGNIVTISKETQDPYGLANISLLPSRLNVSSATELNTTNPISVPQYGADGRMSALTAAGTLHGIYSGTGFVVGGTGVRGIGTKSNMTQQELDFRTASQEYASNLDKAYNLAQLAMQDNAQSIMGIIVNKATDATTFDVTGLQKMVATLYGTSGASVADYLNNARNALVKAIFVSQYANYIGEGKDLTEYVSPKSVTVDENGNATITFTDSVSVTINAADVPFAAQGLYGNLNTKIKNISDNIAAAYAITNTLTTPNSVDEATTNSIMGYLLAADKLTLHGSTVTEIKTALAEAEKVDTDAGKDAWTIEKKGQYVMENYTENDGSFLVQLPKDSGIYADIHQVTGKMVKGQTKYMGFMIVNIQTQVLPADTYVFTFASDKDNTNNGMVTYPQVTVNDLSPNLTDLYAYAIDLGFRTNAQDSYLQLQTTAKNRIYSEGGIDETMGGGSNMTFKSDNANGFTVDDVKELMGAIRIVFVDATGKIVAVAGADTVEQTVTGEDGSTSTVVNKVKANSDADGNVTADIVLYNYTIAYATGDGDDTNGDETANNGKITLTGKKTDDAATADRTESMELVELVRNEATAISAYVYLDGDVVTNGHVATGLTSMTGSVNLQFSSSATLVPMNYTDLQGKTTD